MRPSTNLGRCCLHWVKHMEHDEGFSFGIGAFETMRVADGRCLMLMEHLERLNSALEDLTIDKRVDASYLDGITMDRHLDGRVLKIEVSEKNVVVNDRPVPYTAADYTRGFRLRTSCIRRNETSPFTFMKTLMHGENIMERRRARRDGYDETLFLNTRGEICECSSSNIFFSSEGSIVTPPVSCGMLPGIVRGFLCDRYDVTERCIMPEDLMTFDECFITNSVMGIMPVSSIDGISFESRKAYESIRNECMEAATGRQHRWMRNPINCKMYPPTQCT